MPGITDSTNTHAMCQYYGHEWAKSDMLTAKQKKGYVVEICKRSGCDAARRRWTG